MNRHDTTPDAEHFRIRFLQSLTGSQRVDLAVEMTEDIHRVSRAGIAARHPEYSEADVQTAFVRLLLGDELFKAARPNDALLAP